MTNLELRGSGIVYDGDVPVARLESVWNVYVVNSVEGKRLLDGSWFSTPEEALKALVDSGRHSRGLNSIRSRLTDLTRKFACNLMGLSEWKLLSSESREKVRSLATSKIPMERLSLTLEDVESAIVRLPISVVLEVNANDAIFSFNVLVILDDVSRVEIDLMTYAEVCSRILCLAHAVEYAAREVFGESTSHAIRNLRTSNRSPTGW